MEEQYRTLKPEYKIKDFFKPSLLENILWALEIPASFCTFLVATGITESPLKGIAYSLIPQAGTYIAGRTIELTCRNEKTSLGKIAKNIRNTKIPYSSGD